MRVIQARNVNDAYKEAIEDALRVDNGLRWRRISPRNGEETMEYRTPVATVYRSPRERVLFNYARDANPFFHVMEALWILRGRNDVEWIGQFNKQIQQYSDDGRTFRGAYGYRLRHGVDQISTVINLLNKDPDSRRAVLAMWEVPLDLGGVSKDIPCNTHIYFKIRDYKLHMTVCNRSNDVIWGCYGANYVHFTMLMEYIAAHLDVGIGIYTHFSDSFHIYTENESFRKHWTVTSVPDFRLYDSITPSQIVPLVESTTTFDEELAAFFTSDWMSHSYDEPFFKTVAVPMRVAWNFYKQGNRMDAMSMVEYIKSKDWKIACQLWLDRRKK